MNHNVVFALNRANAAAALGISVAQLDRKTRAGQIKRQPDGAYSLKHLKEYQQRQELAAEHPNPVPVTAKASKGKQPNTDEWPSFRD